MAAHHVAAVRGIIATETIISTTVDPFFDLRALSKYASISVRSLRDHLIDPTHPLPCYRIGGKVLVRRSEFDVWAGQFRTVGVGHPHDADRILRSTA